MVQWNIVTLVVNTDKFYEIKVSVIFILRNTNNINTGDIRNMLIDHTAPSYIVYCYQHDTFHTYSAYSSTETRTVRDSHALRVQYTILA